MEKIPVVTTLNEFERELRLIKVPHDVRHGKVIVRCPTCPSDEPHGLMAFDESGKATCERCRQPISFEEALVHFGFRSGMSDPLSTGTISVKLQGVSEILEIAFEKLSWLVEDFIPLPSIDALSGAPGDFKTWLMMSMAICVARGLPLFGKLKAQQGRVLVVDEENALQHLQKRLQALGAAKEDPIDYISLAGVRIDDEAIVKELAALIAERKYKLVIIDSLIRIHGQDENSAQGMSKVISGLQELMKQGAAVVFTHHHRKQASNGKNYAQNLRGSSDILAGVDAHFAVARKDEKTLVIRQPKARHSEAMKPFEIEIVCDADGTPSDFKYLGDHNEEKSKAEEAEVEVRVLLEAESVMSRQRIHEALDDQYGQKAIDAAIRNLIKVEEVERVPKGEVPEELKGEGPQHFYRIKVSL